MNTLDSLLLISLVTTLVSGLGQRHHLIGWISAILFSAQFLTLLVMGGLGYGGAAVESSLHLSIFGQPLSWRFDGLSWFFALITIGAALASSAFAAGCWAKDYKKQGLKSTRR